MKGDVIEVKDEGLKILDDFEEHPDWYERMITDVQLTGKWLLSGKVLKCCEKKERKVERKKS